MDFYVLKFVRQGGKLIEEIGCRAYLIRMAEKGIGISLLKSHAVIYYNNHVVWEATGNSEEMKLLVDDRGLVRG